MSDLAFWPICATMPLLLSGSTVRMQVHCDQAFQSFLPFRPFLFAAFALSSHPHLQSSNNQWRR